MTESRSGARASDEWVERVRAASEIVDVIGESVPLKRVGRNWVGLCPFHKEKTPSFSVNAERQFYHCFSCKAGGDVFTFVQEMEKVGFLEAVERLSRRANIPVPERRAGERNVRAPLLEALEAAATAYEQWLGDPTIGSETRAYLEGRGISEETRRAFRLGLAPAGWDHLVRRLAGRFPDTALIEARLAARRETPRGGLYDWFRGRLMVPLVLPGGAVVGFGARALAPGDEPKYLNSQESAVYHKSGFLFALEQARRAVERDGEMVVVEGYFDAIALHQAGVRHTVATSGTALTEEQAKLLHRHAARVALTYDGDRAGRAATMRSLGTLLAEGLEVVVVDLPAGEDPDTLLRRGGLDAWREARARAADPVEFVQRHLLRGAAEADAPASDPRARALHAVVALASAIGDPIRQRLLLDRASDVFGMPVQVLTRALALAKRGERIEQPIGAAVRARHGLEAQQEHRLVQALRFAPEALDDVRRDVSPEDFHDPEAGALALALWSGAPEPAEGPVATLARELDARAEEGLDWAAEARMAARRLVERRLKQQLKERRQQLDRAPDAEHAARLNQEILDLARTLRDLSNKE
ncbi:MAG TPA: DNA primase [Candidatus Saccharimonadaceae bacterium]|jgi:DNA primase|nr:DNA primase [Candidatus Saccharimonadaceae bacterium]